MSCALITWEQVAQLGGAVGGDPRSTRAQCNECFHQERVHPDLPKQCTKPYIGIQQCPLVLPESGALMLRILWRHFGGRELGVMDVPMLLHAADFMWILRGPGKWLIELPCAEANHITDPCEALAAIVAAEVKKVEKQ